MRTPEEEVTNAPATQPNLLLDPSARQEHKGVIQAESMRTQLNDFNFAEDLAGAFFERGLAAYDKFLHGEKWAKQMHLALLAMGAENGMGGILMGDPGGGKSFFLDNGHAIVKGVEPEHIARIPHSAELTKAQLIGDETPMVRSGIDREGNSYEESFTAIVKPIIRPETKVLKADEINRAGQFAIQSLLGVLQAGRALVYEEGKQVETGTFDLFLAALNNYGTEYTFRLDPALLNRFAMGAIMGVRPRGGLTEAAKYRLSHPNEARTAKPEVEEVIDTESLHIIRNGIHQVKYPQAEQGLTGTLIARMLDTFEDVGLSSTDVRITEQVMRISQTLSMFRKRPVTDVDVKSAVNYAMTGRLGSMGNKTTDEIQTRVSNVIK